VTQRALRRINGNAAPAHRSLRSTHLTGAATDISRRSLAERTCGGSGWSSGGSPRRLGGYPPRRLSALLRADC
jgi:hypothetical protein